LKREVWAQVRSVGTESAFLSPMPLKTMSETNRNVSRTAELLAIPRDTIRVCTEWYGLRLGVHTPPTPSACAPACRPGAGQVGGGLDPA